jgi:hypothetical protein
MGYVARRGQQEMTTKFLSEILRGEGHLKKPSRSKGNIKMGHTRMWCGTTICSSEIGSIKQGFSSRPKITE